MDSGGTAANGGKTAGSEALCGNGAMHHGYIITCRHSSVTGNGKLLLFTTCNSCKLLPSSESTPSSRPDLPMFTRISAAAFMPSISPVKNDPFLDNNKLLNDSRAKQDIPE
jgi:hypothetical protein